jgi:hypothetical protein
MTTVLLHLSTDGRLHGSFLASINSGTIDEARASLTSFHEGMTAGGYLQPNEKLVGLTFSDRTLDEIEREFPYLFGYGECDCEHGGYRHE